MSERPRRGGGGEGIVRYRKRKRLGSKAMRLKKSEIG